jgi:hypothetical protein
MLHPDEAMRPPDVCRAGSETPGNTMWTREGTCRLRLKLIPSEAASDAENHALEPISGEGRFAL